MYGHDELFNTRQAATFLGVEELTVRQAIQQGTLRAWRMPQSREMLIRKRDLLPFRDPTHALTAAPRQLTLFSDDAA